MSEIEIAKMKFDLSMRTYKPAIYHMFFINALILIIANIGFFN